MRKKKRDSILGRANFEYNFVVREKFPKASTFFGERFAFACAIFSPLPVCLNVS